MELQLQELWSERANNLLWVAEARAPWRVEFFLNPSRDQPQQMRRHHWEWGVPGIHALLLIFTSLTISQSFFFLLKVPSVRYQSVGIKDSNFLLSGLVSKEVCGTYNDWHLEEPRSWHANSLWWTLPPESCKTAPKLTWTSDHS